MFLNFDKSNTLSMVIYMKTTIDIAPGLFEQSKQAASSEHTTFKALVEEGLQYVLEKREQEKTKFVLRETKSRGGGFQPEFENAGWDVIRDAAYEGRST